jgi:hypothetical protein
MKGTVETEVLITIGIIVSTISLTFAIYEIVNDVFNEFARSSAEVVARDLSSIASLTSAAPHEIHIRYNPDIDRQYAFTISDMLLSVKLVVGSGRDCGELFPLIKAEVSKSFCEGLAKMNIDPLDASFSSSFADIRKTFSGTSEGLPTFTYQITEGGPSS